MKILKTVHVDFVFVALVFFYNYRSINWGFLAFLGLVVTLVCFSLWILARVQLGRYFTVRPEAHGLVTTGLYAKVRNPVYLYSSLAILGAILPSRSILQYSVFIILVVIQLVRSKKEGKILAERFGNTYVQYKLNTWI